MLKDLNENDLELIVEKNPTMKNVTGNTTEQTEIFDLLNNIRTYGVFRVKNMTSSRGNFIPNQFIIYTNKATIFQSYESIIAASIEVGFTDSLGNYSLIIKTCLDENTWDYSKTTGKYRNIFLGETRKETEKKIKSGEYILTDLNNRSRNKW